MLKIVVFDSGYGGELFADRLEEELPVVDVIRVIDWRHSAEILKNPKSARHVAREALRPYIGRVDLIIFANYLLSATSLKYFRRKYPEQRFIGLKLPRPRSSVGNARPTVILTTRALAHTINYYNYLFHLDRRVDTICLDRWPVLIDDGELTLDLIAEEVEKLHRRHRVYPGEVILACSQFSDITPELRIALRNNSRICDSFQDAIAEVGKVLKIRGGTGRRRH